MEVSATDTTSAASASPVVTQGRGDDLGKEDFLQLMVTQMTQQDPLNPQDGTEYVAQLAEFSGLERMLNMEKAMGNMVLAASSTNSTLAVGFIGKDIKMTGDSFHLGADRQAKIDFTTDKAAVATVSIKNEDGTIVRTFEVPAKAGENAVTWDGLDDEGVPVEEGKYTVEVTASTSEGEDVGVKTEAIQRVKAVSFTNGYPELVLENGEKVSLAEVSEVVGNDTDPQEEE